MFAKDFKRSHKVNFSSPIIIDACSILTIPEINIFTLILTMIKSVGKLILILIIIGIFIGILLFFGNPDRKNILHTDSKQFFWRSMITGIASMFGEMGFVSENATPNIKGLLISISAILLAFIFIVIIQGKLTSDIIKQHQKGVINKNKEYIFLAHEGDKTPRLVQKISNNFKIKYFKNISNEELINIYYKNRDKYNGVVLSYVSAYPLLLENDQLYPFTEDLGIMLEYFIINKKKKNLVNDIDKRIAELFDTKYMNKMCKTYYNLNKDDITCDLI